MSRALEWVAERDPTLAGAALTSALAATGYVDAGTARRLLPWFSGFDPNRHFSYRLRQLSCGGEPAGDEFRRRIAVVLRDLAGAAKPGRLASEPALRFSHGEREGVLLAYPRVSLSLSGSLLQAVRAASKEMPDTLVIVARNFRPGVAGELGGLLSGTEVPGTLVSVNRLLGMRAVARRYRPAPEKIVQLLSAGREVNSADLGRLGDR